MKFIEENRYLKWFGGEPLIQFGESLGLLSYRKRAVNNAFSTVDRKILIFNDWSKELLSRLSDNWTLYIEDYCAHYNLDRLHKTIARSFKENKTWRDQYLSKKVVLFKYHNLLVEALKNTVNREYLQRIVYELKQSRYSTPVFINGINRYAKLPNNFNIEKKYNVLYYIAANNKLFNSASLAEINVQYRECDSVFEKIKFINTLYRDIRIFNKGLLVHRYIKNSMITIIQKRWYVEALSSPKEDINISKETIYELWKLVKQYLFSQKLKEELSTIHSFVIASLPYVKYMKIDENVIGNSYEKIEKQFKSSRIFNDTPIYINQKRDEYMRWFGGKELVEAAEKLGVCNYRDIIINESFSSSESKITIFKRWSDELIAHISENYRPYISEYCFKHGSDPLLLKAVDDASAEIAQPIRKNIAYFKYHNLLKQSLYHLITSKSLFRSCIRELEKRDYASKVFIKIIDKCVELPKIKQLEDQCEDVYNFAVKCKLFNRDELEKIRKEYSNISNTLYKLDFIDNLKNKLKDALRKKASKLYYDMLCEIIYKRLILVHDRKVIDTMRDNLRYLYSTLEKTIEEKSNVDCVEKYAEKILRSSGLVELMRLNNIEHALIDKKVETILKTMKTESPKWFEILNCFFPDPAKMSESAKSLQERIPDFFYSIQPTVKRVSAENK